ncbi:MAG: PAS domain S-box protein [Candidatus Omnitrophica bacterium]|nr:PAS domain S-box protein [Candidatus Omnitrophota bacterium]
MKKCPRCKTQYNNLWYKCMKCRIELILQKGEISLFKKTSYVDPASSGYLLEQLIDQANALIIFTTTDGEALMCNEAVEFFTGYKREDIFRQGWLDLLYKQQLARKEMFRAVMKGCLISIKSKTYESSIIRKDGTECMLSWRLSAIRDKKNNNLGILCVGHDITDKKITEDDIDIHGQNLKDILTSIREYVLMTTNLEGKITYYGLGARNIFGWPPDEVYLEDISLIYPKYSRSETIKKLSENMQKNGKFENEVQLVRKDSVEFSAILTVTPLINRQSQTIGYTYMAKDITDKKKMEQQMIRSEKMAAVGQLASGIAHEINNPLLVIMGRIDLLEEEKMPADVSKALETVRSQSQRIRILVDRLLSYSREKKPDAKPLDLNKLLQTITPLLSYYPEFKKVVWKENFQQDLPMVKGDFNQLQEVFINLGLNACQAMAEGGEIVITTRYDEAGQFTEALVKDTGPGMANEQLQRIFDPFFTTKEKGTGLGLSICRNIIDQHKGKIDVESSPGKGTTFIVRLPPAD